MITSREQSRAYRQLVIWTCASTACGLFVLITFARELIHEEMRLGIKPFMPLWSIPWVSGALVVVLMVGLYALSKSQLDYPYVASNYSDFCFGLGRIRCIPRFRDVYSQKDRALGPNNPR